MSAPLFAVVGHPNKGKSSIVATLASDDSVRIGSEAGTTTRCRRFPMTLDGEELYVLVDTPGFQRSRRALDWMRRQETTADRHPDVVRAFVEAHRESGRFPDECELLSAVLEGAGILYVVDGSVPYGPEYEPEMEILRWTGQPSMALINPIRSADHVESWRAALGQFFKVVREFNAVTAEFSKRTELLRAFGQLREEWRQPLARAVRSLEQDRSRARRLAAGFQADMIVRMLNHSVERKLSNAADSSALRKELEEQFRADLRKMEGRCRDQVEQVYSHRRLERREEALSLVDADLFAEKTWLVFGLSKRQLAATGAMSGAAAGLLVDAHLAGASLLMGAAIGAGVGGAAGWWTAGRLVRVRVLDVPLGGKKLVGGPTRNLNFPHVVFNRARHHHWIISRRAHAVREELTLAEESASLLPALGAGRRSELEKCFAAFRRDPGSSETAAVLRRLLEAILSEDDATVGG